MANCIERKRDDEKRGKERERKTNTENWKSSLDTVSIVEPGEAADGVCCIINIHLKTQIPVLQ